MLIAMPDEPDPDRSREFKWLKRLGAGQFGEVWLVESPTGTRHALKVMLRPTGDGADATLRSLKWVKSDLHPHLLRIDDFWVEKHKLYVLSELADGTLRDWLAGLNPGKKGPREYTRGVPAGELLHVMREAAGAIDHLHAKRMIHRNVKPDNLLLLDRRAKVADFACSPFRDPAASVQSVMAGSPAYMAPEVWSGRFGPASDLYSLAITYAELRQGRLPIPLGPMTVIMFAHLEGQFEFREEAFARGELTVVRRALAKDLGKRFGSCTEFVNELVKAVGVSPTPPRFPLSES